MATNLDIDYVQKDYNSAIDAMISFATTQYGPGTSANRLWTNFNADSFSRNWLEIVAYISDVFFFYFDNQATQSYLQTATVRSAINDIAKQFGFTPATATSSSGVANFTCTGAGSIPRGFRIESSNGEQFYVTNAVTVIGAGTVNANVLQGIIKSETFTAQGLQNEEFNLTGPNVIRDLTNTNPQDISPTIVVNGNSYTLVSSFIRHNGEDSAAIVDSLGNIIGGGGRVFVLEERSDGTPYIKFGDGIFGRKLQPGEVLSVSYRTGGGSAGNISENTLVNLIDSNPIVSSVSNSDKFSGGADQQTIAQLRDLIPSSLRTLDRAVAEQDYSDILKANFTEVFDASTEKNTTQAGIDLNIYVVPQGSGIPQISDNILLKNKLSSYIDRRKMVTIQFQILDAFGMDILLGLEVFISNTASKTTVNQAITTALQDYFSLTTGGANSQGIQFSEHILLKDIANIIEAISGVERFEIKKLTYRPRIDENIVGIITDYQFSNVTIFPNISESEWLLAAKGTVTETVGTLIFSNTNLVGFTYTTLTGLIQYASNVDLSGVAPGDQFKDGAGTGFTIFAVDLPNNSLSILEGQTVNTTVTTSAHGSVLNGATSYEAFKCFKKLLATATNLSTDSITDNNLDLTIFSSTGTAISSRVLLDNSSIIIPGQYATGEYYLVDSSFNIWEIVENDSNTIKTSITAINDAAITSVSSGTYNIVKKLIGYQVAFNESIFNIQYNNTNTCFSIGGQFNQIGTIGDSFQIAKLQNNVGNLGVGLDLIAFNNGTGNITLNGSPDLSGVSSDWVLIDKDGQQFNVVGTDNRTYPAVFYDVSNKNSEVSLKGVSSPDAKLAQSFEVTANNTYSVVSFYLKREGNIIGNLTASIVNDNAGVPNISSPVAISNPISVTSIAESFEKVEFTFTIPPTLSTGTTYWLVLSPDVGYASAYDESTISFNNVGQVGFSYNSISGVVSYDSSVSLVSVVPGHYIKDAASNYFKILAVDDANNQLILDAGLTFTGIVTPTGDATLGSCFVRDRISAGLDNSSPTYTDGEYASFNDGTSLWTATSSIDAIFSVEGTRSIKIQSNLTPSLGTGATVSQRYYDDANEMSLTIGIASGSITSATDANAIGKGTVGSIANRDVDNFVFRSSRYADDVVNLRLNEIPQIQDSDISITIYGGID